MAKMGRVAAGVGCGVVTAALLLLAMRPGDRVQAAASGVQSQAVTAPAPVLVELFTSEGCSSCPPADVLLASLYRTQPVPGAEIVILEEHVDYWDRLGWKDRFSSAEFTARQQAYGAAFRLDDIYTPQMVVNGTKQLNGTDAAGVRAAIAKEAASGLVSRLRVEEVAVHGGDVSVRLAPEPSLPDQTELYVAVVDAEATTQVRAGENGGRTLHHAGVVRVLKRAGEPTAGWSFRLAPGTNFASDSAGKRLIVFAQRRHAGAVVGLATCTFLTQGEQSSGVANRCPVRSI
jgi:hypothetical protein